MRRIRKALILGVATAAVGVVLAATPLDWELEERYGLWWLFVARGPIDPPPDVVIIDVDSPAELPRTVHAQLIEKLTQLNPSVIAIDIFYRQSRGEQDVRLMEAIAASRRVVLVQLADEDEQTRLLEITDPVGRLAGAAVGLAPAPLTLTATGMSRFWAFMPVSANAIGRPTLPAVALQVHAMPVLGRLAGHLRRLGQDQLAGRLRQSVSNPEDLRYLIDSLRHGLSRDPELFGRLSGRIATDGSRVEDPDTDVLSGLLSLYAGTDDYVLNVYSGSRGICKIAYEVLLAGDEMVCSGRRVDLAGKAVFVGDDTQSDPLQRRDRYFTVYSGVGISGVEIAATAFANLLTGRMVRFADPFAYYGILMAFGVVIGVLAYLLSARYAVPLILGLGAAYFVSAVLLYSRLNFLIPVAVPIVAQLPLALFVGLFSRYLILRRYVPYEAAEPGTKETVDGVCLTTDVSGYTTVAESLSPDAVAELMSEYFEILTSVATRHGGMVTGLAGDRMVCVWRRTDTSARERASRAALEIRETVDRFNKRPGDDQLLTRIGLHLGVFDLRSIGGANRYEFQPVGDVPNTAARIEDLNKRLGTWILASEAVVQGLETLTLRRVGMFLLPGKSEPTAIFEILGRADSGAAMQQLCRDFSAALEASEAGRWADAAEMFGALHDRHTQDGPTRYHRTRCHELHEAEPSPKPTGVIVLEKE